jgi:branched-chain amino acid transport system ATP-binding protein
MLEVSGLHRVSVACARSTSVNLRVEAGTVAHHHRTHGAGKSTLLNCFVGRLIPDTGTVTFNGTSLIG